MSDLDATTPRIFLARHGETEWTISGQHTGRSDIPLTALGERQVASTGTLLVGSGKLVDPANVRKVWVSPRQRALKTFQLFFAGEGTVSDAPGAEKGVDLVAGVMSGEIFGGGRGCVVVTEEIREWDYGEYEGMKADDVRDLRRSKGLDGDGRKWNVWRDGCMGGEYVRIVHLKPPACSVTCRWSKEDVERRLDRLIEEVKEVQKPYMNGEGAGDVVLVAHGLILRCFFKRWLRLSIDHPSPMMMPPGAIAVLSYKNHSLNEPSFNLGMAIPASEQ